MDIKNSKYIKPVTAAVAALSCGALIFALGGFAGGPGGGRPGGGMPGGMPGAAAPSAAGQNVTIAVNVTYPERETLQRKTDFAGRIEASQTVKVYPEVSGTVAKTYVNAGDYVQKGDLLFEFDSENAAIALEKAELTYQSTINDIDKAETGSSSILTERSYQDKITSAENAYIRARDALDGATDSTFNFRKFKEIRDKLLEAEKLYDADPNDETWKNFTSAMKDYEEKIDEYDNYLSFSSTVASYESAYDSYLQALEDYDIYKSMTAGEDAAARDIRRAQAELTLADARKAYANQKVYAPVSGIVSGKNINEYDSVGANTVTYTISQEGMAAVSFNLSEDGANAMDIGTEVTVLYNGKEYAAEVTELAPEANSNTGLYPAKAQLTEDIGTNRSGAVIKVTAITAIERDTLTISLDNIYYDGNQAYVYVYDNGVARRTDVTVGMTTVDKVSLTEGVSDTDAIITTWHPRLSDGALVSNSALDGANAAK